MNSMIDFLERGASAHPDKLLYSFLDGLGRERDTYSYLAFHERTARMPALRRMARQRASTTPKKVAV